MSSTDEGGRKGIRKWTLDPDDQQLASLIHVEDSKRQLIKSRVVAHAVNSCEVDSEFGAR